MNFKYKDLCAKKQTHFNGYGRIHSVQIIQINYINAKALSAFLECSLDILRITSDGFLAPHSYPKFRGEEYLITLSSAFEPVKQK